MVSIMDKNRPEMERRIGRLLDDQASENHWYTDRTGNLTRSIKTRGYDASVELYVADTAPYSVDIRKVDDFLAHALEDKESDILMEVQRWLDICVEEWNNG